jgi:heat shock protein HslJ
MRRLLIALGPALVLAVVVPTACGDDDGDAATTTAADRTTTTAAETGPLVGTAWILSTWSDAGTMVDAATASAATLRFAGDGEFSGTTGCNNFAGPWTDDDGKLRMVLGPMTQMACIDPELQKQEEGLVALLNTATGYDLSDETLKLKGSDGAELAVYETQPTGIFETAWTVTGVNNGVGGLQSVDPTQALTANFGADGKFSGEGGCNQIRATWESEKDEVSIDDVASTKKSCDEAVMDLETQYVAALEAVFTYERSGDTLTLRDDEGAMQVTLKLATG